LLGRAISAEPDFDCVGAVHTVEEAVSRTRARTPDAVVMDVQIGTGDGLTATAALLALDPALRVVVLTAYATPSLLQRAMDAGARALLPKDGSLEDLLAALRDIDGDGFRVHPALLRRLLELRSGPREVHVRLTAREDQVLQMLADGLDPSTIARRLGISWHTSRGYVAALLAKLDAHSQLEAVAVARRRGMLRDPA
ncbi:MAG: response regulator, partial [Phycicoccus sp.]